MQTLSDQNVGRDEKLPVADDGAVTWGEETVELTEAGQQEVERMQSAQADSYPPRRPVDTVAEVVRVQRLELVNAAGEVRGVLSCSLAGNPSLTLLSADGHSSVELSLIEDCRPGQEDGALPTIGFMAGGNVRMMVGLEQDGTPSVDIIDADGHCVMSLNHPAARR